MPNRNTTMIFIRFDNILTPIYLQKKTLKKMSAFISY